MVHAVRITGYPELLGCAGMPEETKDYKFACFISYKHPPAGNLAAKHFWLEFVEEFQNRLESYLNTKIRTYRDIQLKSKPGIRYPEELSKSLCHSVCMIAILVPEYLESNWCIGEWRAMEKLESKRGRADLIIPVLLRGDPDKMSDLYGTREPIDLRKIIKPSTQLDSVKNRSELESIAARIQKFAKSLDDTCMDCNQFVIGLGPEQMTPSVQDPDPLEH